MSILHFLGGSAIELAGERAIVQTKMTISQRGAVEGVPYDVMHCASTTSWCCRRAKWKLLHRQPIYEKDRVDPIDPAADRDPRCGEAGQRCPRGYRHTA